MGFQMIKAAETEEEIDKCFPVMAELRPRLNRDEFVGRVRRQITNEGYCLVFLQNAGEVRSVGGIRIGEWLSGGRYLEIEDLVSAEGERSKGFGSELFDWIAEYALAEGCKQIKLVSRVNRLPHTGFI
jgi:GNAT superfamily N-acetyltransferase